MTVEARPETRARGGNLKPAPVGRIASLDWVRGLFLCLSVGTVSVLPPRPEQLRHADWFGITAQDMIFPLFVTLSGAGLAFAYRNSVGWGRTIRRSVVLLIAGLGYNAVTLDTYDITELRWTGPLQIYAVLVLVIGLLHRVARGPKAWALITLVVAVGQAVFLYLWQGTCAGGELSPECNPSGVIDPAVLGTAHVYAGNVLGHDPEGLIAVLGAMVTAAAGATAGHLALASRGTRRGPAHLLGWAAIVLTAAFVFVQFLPAMKRLWTTPFALGIGALGIVALGLGMAILDLPAGQRWSTFRDRMAWPQVAMGRNSLLVYFGSHLLMFLLLTRGGENSYAHRLADTVDVIGNPTVSLVVFMIVAWAALAAVLHKFKIYLRP